MLKRVKSKSNKNMAHETNLGYATAAEIGEYKKAMSMELNVFPTYAIEWLCSITDVLT
jgi:hypothetical protein